MTMGSKVYMIYVNDRAYPDYLITYKNSWLINFSGIFNFKNKYFYSQIHFNSFFE
jgi:hypothetical protein